jgi:hypothetical protein
MSTTELPVPPTDALLRRVVREVVGDSAAGVVDVGVERVAYTSSSPATGGLHRVTGTARRADGRSTSWSVFVKTLQHPRIWPQLQELPADQVERFAAEFPWRWELEQYRALAGRLPDGLRSPVIHAVDESRDGYCVLWMEDIDQSPAPWTLERYARAARALGRLAARGWLERQDAPPRFPVGYALRLYVTGRVLPASVPPIHDDAVWASPLLSEAVDDELRRDLVRLTGMIDPWLDRLDALPQALAHGDASPQNLLVPSDGDGFVVIDWGFGSPLAVGFDLGQLLLGLVQSGGSDPADLPDIHDTILPAYVQGLDDEGLVVPQEVVRFGYVASMVLRSAFGGLMWERLDEPDTPSLRRRFRERAAMTRFVVDLGLGELPVRRRLDPVQ